MKEKYSLWLSNGKEYLGPIGSRIVTTNPNETIIFRIIDVEWIEKLGWKKDSVVEVQAIPEPEEIPCNSSLRRRNIWQDIYVYRK